MALEGISVDPHHPTGQVTITLQDKDARFDIRADQAYDHIDQKLVAQLSTTQPVTLLYHGSLIARSPQNRELLARMADRTGLPAFVDVNLRDPWWNQQTVTEMMARARWVKLNSDELSALVPGTEGTRAGLARAAETLRDRFGLELVIVTQGADGALICARDGTVAEKAPAPESVIDTVGAGDAFSAVTIYGLSHGWTPQVMLQRALFFASAVVAQRGATSMDESLYHSHLAAWGATSR